MERCRELGGKEKMFKNKSPEKRVISMKQRRSYNKVDLERMRHQFLSLRKKRDTRSNTCNTSTPKLKLNS